MQRVLVIGVTGSGKTTPAASLATKLRVPHVELGALHWEPNWTMAELDVFRRRVARQVSADGWVVDGNYAKVRYLVWGRADTVVWLDYSSALTFARLLRRTLACVSSGEELWNGNRERFAEQFLSRDSQLLWAIKTYPTYRATFPCSWRATHAATCAWSGYGHPGMLRNGWAAYHRPDKASCAHRPEMPVSVGMVSFGRGRK